jgi:alkanesulfonate monooxygenase SsuD/methylene tetrahydromethanopterin reductase-like flavin-dependent oxidoreductase (luciferase family)
MKIGAVMFFTADSMQPAPLARALEERGFESLWVPEHTHIPSTRKTAYPAGGGLIRPYYDIMDPFLVLTAAVTVTTSRSSSSVTRSSRRRRWRPSTS